jgi:anti-sigma factor RsiW
MWTCDVIKPLLALRAEDWSAVERAQVETHLEQCAACAALRAVYLEQDRLIRDLPAVDLTAAQRAEVWARIPGPERESRGAIFVGLNVLSALSTTVGLVMLLVNVLSAAPALRVEQAVPVATVLTVTSITARETTSTSDVAFQVDEELEPTPEPAPRPETSYLSDHRSRIGKDTEAKIAVFGRIMADTKETV